MKWLSEREQRAWRGFQFMQMRLNARLARDLAENSSLAVQDYAVLVALTDRPDGRMRLFEMAHELGWEKSRLSHHITRMAKRGLVIREACASDRRGAYVAVTKQGRKEIEAAAPSHAEAVRRLFVDQLTKTQLDTIANAAEAVLTAVDKECS